MAPIGSFCDGDCHETDDLLAGLVRDAAPAGKPGSAYTVFILGSVFQNTAASDDYFSGGADNIGIWFYRQIEEPPPIPAEDGIDRVEIYIDGEYVFDVPYGGERTDVAEMYPDIGGSNQSGFSLAFGYSNLGVGKHTVAARAFTKLGESNYCGSDWNATSGD